MELSVRKIVTVTETTLQELGRTAPSTRKVAAAAVIVNPYAGRYSEDLRELVDGSPTIAALLIDQALEALGHPVEEVRAYGKAAIVGTNGEIEHAAALIHPRFGAPIRHRLGKGPAIIPSTKLLGGPGTRITIPITNCNEIWTLDDMDAIAISIDDAPRPDEILVAVAIATGGRPFHRTTLPT